MRVKQEDSGRQSFGIEWEIVKTPSKWRRHPSARPPRDGGPDQLTARPRRWDRRNGAAGAALARVSPLVDVVEPAGVEGRGAPDDAVDLVALAEQQLGK